MAGRKSLAVTAGGEQISIAVGDQAPDKISAVIELDLDGPPKVVKPVR